MRIYGIGSEAHLHLRNLRDLMPRCLFENQQ